MSGSFFNRRVDQVVKFKDPNSMFTVDVKLESIRLFVADAGGRELVLTIWFDYAVMKQIDRTHTFGYAFETLALFDGQPFELVSWKPIQMELRGEGAALEALAKADGEELLDQAAAALTGTDESPLLDSSNYKFLSIYQEHETDGRTYLKGADSKFKKG